MSMKLSRKAYEDLIAGDLAWLALQPDTLERNHIEAIICESPDKYYPSAPDAGQTVAEDVRELANFAKYGRTAEDGTLHMPSRDELIAEIERYVQGRVDKALSIQSWDKAEAANRYALSLVEGLAKQYGCVAEWRPLPDLLGRLTQIDNIATGFKTRAAAAESSLFDARQTIIREGLARDKAEAEAKALRETLTYYVDARGPEGDEIGERALAALDGSGKEKK